MTVRMKQEEKILQEREQFLNAVLETSVDGFWVVDTNGIIIEANRAACAMMGYPMEALVGSHINDIDALDTSDQVKERIRRIIRNSSETFDTRLRRKDGRIVAVEISTTYLPTNGGRFVCFCRDLTERERRDERIALQSWMLDAAPVSVMIIGLDGAILHTNRTCLAMHGYRDEAAFRALNLRDLDTPESHALMAERIQRVLAQGEARFEVHHYRKDGTPFPLEVLAKAIEWEGRPGVLSISTDITERKRSEERNRYQLGLITSLLDSIPDIVFYKDMDGVYLGCNEEFARHVGRSRNDIIGKSDYDLYSKKEADEFRANDRRMLASGGPRRNDEWISYPDGCRVLLDTLKTVLRDTDGNRIGTLGISRDITEQKAIQDHREAQLFFSKAMNKISETIISSDEPDHILAISNQIIGETMAVDRTLIYRISFKEDRLTGLCEWLRRHHPDIAPTVGEYPLALFRAPFTEIRKTRNYLESHRDSVGAPFLMDGSGEMLHGHFKIKSLIWYPFAFDEDGFHVFTINQILQPRQWSDDEIVFLESVAKLVSIALMKIKLLDERRRMSEEHEKLRKQFLQSQKMESVGRLAGGVAHDFNNMLSVILGHSELLIENIPPDAPSRNNLEEIKNAAKRSADLTRQLLAFARKQTVSPKVLDLNQTIESMLKMLGRLIGEDIDLIWKPAEALDPVHIDPSQIDQLLVNLCVNARDAIGPRAGKLTIETGRAALGAADCAENPDIAPGDYMMITVSDSGSGMDKATLANIFEPFFTTKGVGEGTGLGLATVFGIVKQNRGFIDVTSDPGRGTAFKIYLPAHTATKGRPKHGAVDTEPVTGGNESILLVEDEPATLNMTRMMLERMGYIVLAAPTPEDAIRLVERHAGGIHLLMTDVVMPGMNGHDLARAMLSRHPEIKCLFMSGYPADIIAHQGVLDEGVNFIQKPFSKPSLTVKVRETLDAG